MYEQAPGLGDRLNRNGKGNVNAMDASAAAVDVPEGGRKPRKAAAAPFRIGRFSSILRLVPDLFLASVVINLLGLVMPLTMLQMYDRIIPHQSTSTLGLLVGGVVLALLLDALVRMARSHLTGWIGARFEHRASCAAVRRMLDARLGDYERVGSSTHLERLRATVAVRDFYSGQALLSLFDLPFIAIFIALIAIIAGPLVFVPLTLIAAFVAVAWWHGRKLKAALYDRIKFDERRFSFIADTLGGIHSIKGMALEGVMQRRYEMLQDTNAKMSFDSSKRSITALNIGWMFSQLSTVLVVAFGAALVVMGEMTPGSLAACIMLSGRSLAPLQSALGTWVRFQGFSVARRQLETVFELPASPQVGKPALPQVEGVVELRNAGFGFPGRATNLFEDLTLLIKPGECIGIVGDSGSGKTTLLSMLAGLTAPTSGSVMVDGYDLANFSSASLSRRIAYLPQRGELFNGTILENITMFDPSLDATALEVARGLGLDKVVATMRNGYETVVGNTAADAMPGGVKQRIAIARALVHRPKVVLFDEANLAIDSAGDEDLRALLASMKGDRTMVLVTHRPSLLNLADRVFEIKGSRLVASTAQEALSNSGPVADVESKALVPERPAVDQRIAATVLSRFKVQTDLSMCLVGLLTAMGWRGNPRQLAEALPHVADSLDLTGVRRVMANLNYTCDSFRANLTEIDDLSLPCLFLPDDGHAQVLLSAEEDGTFAAFDGESVAMKRVPRGAVPGIAHVFRPVEAPARGAQRASWIRGIFARFRPMIWLGLLLTVGINLLTLATPGFVMFSYDRVLPSGDLGAMPYLVAGVMVALVVALILRRLRAQMLSFMGARTEFAVGTTIFQRILALPAWSTEQAAVGSQVARIKDFESMRDMFVGPVALLAYDLPGALIFVIVLALINPWLVPVILVVIVAFLLLGALSQPGLSARAMVASRASSQRAEFLSDTLVKMRAIKYAGAEDRWFERFRQLSAKSVAHEFKAQQYTERVSIAAGTISQIAVIAAITTAVLGVFAGTTSVGAVVAVMILVFRLVGPLQSAFLSMGTLVRVTTSMRQIDNLMRLKGDRDSLALRQAPPALKGEVSFARVSFRYSQDADPALLGVTFRVLPGQVCAIAGPNGSGKSTIIKLITGIYTPQAGSVRLDNIDIRQIDPGDLRSIISYAPQHCDMFFGTIAQNLRLVYPLATDEELRWATHMAGLYNDIMAMPRGFDTRVADGQADQLPHGFRQRLSLARAYLKPAPVLLFDEPGNGLDYEADLAFQRAVGTLRGKTTIVLASHRPSHLKMADVVVYMEDGYVRQVGSWEQVSPLIMGKMR